MMKYEENNTFKNTEKPNSVKQFEKVLMHIKFQEGININKIL